MAEIVEQVVLVVLLLAMKLLQMKRAVQTNILMGLRKLMEQRKRKTENFHQIWMMIVSVLEAAKLHTCLLFRFLFLEMTAVAGQEPNRKMPKISVS